MTHTNQGRPDWVNEQLKSVAYLGWRGALAIATVIVLIACVIGEGSPGLRALLLGVLIILWRV